MVGNSSVGLCIIWSLVMEYRSAVSSNQARLGNVSDVGLGSGEKEQVEEAAWLAIDERHVSLPVPV